MRRRIEPLSAEPTVVLMWPQPITFLLAMLS
jgi:hypothetical protein